MGGIQHSVKLSDADVAQIKFEYVVDEVPPTAERIILGAALSARGDQGWELVQIIDGVAIYKRFGVHKIDP